MFIIKKIIKKKKMEGSALLLTIMILSSIFIIAAGSAYMSITSMAKVGKFTENMKANQVAISGAEKFIYEINVVGSYSLEDPCLGPDSPIFYFNIGDNEANCKVYCDDSSGSNVYYSFGCFKNSNSLIEIDVE
jgi:hypothetical protein